MSAMRVKQLANEMNMDPKDLVKKLNEIGIAVKTHASPMSEDDVKLARQKLAKEVVEAGGKVDAATKKKVEAELKKTKEKEQEELEERKRAREAELKEREAHRRKTGAKKPETSAASESKSKKDVAVSAADIKEAVKKIATETKDSGLSKLEKQILEEKDRAKREAAAKKLLAQVKKNKAEADKKARVEQNLRHKNAPKVDANKPAQAKPKKKLTTPQSSDRFKSLLEQVESEKKRMSKAAAAAATTKKNAQVVPELENAESGEDRYKQMAVEVEKLQRDKVLAEARAAVQAAASKAGEGRRKKRKEKREEEARERAEAEAIAKGLDPSLVLDESVVEIPEGASVGKVSELLGVPSGDIVKRLFLLGSPLTLTQMMSNDLIELIADDLDRKVRIVSPDEEYAVVINDTEDDLKPRPPVVTVMGHVDHGKTSLLDAIRHTGVVSSEAGGITQHIGASVVTINDRQITFIDTPGHEAFTAMRARGAQVTDVIVLVVAADDGVMPQTIEAINHAKAANVPIVVAVNKVDKDGANPERVRTELTEYGVIPEEWGGSNMFVDVSAKKKLHIDDLLETILLQADVLELKANPDALASGFVIESNLDKGRGPVATVLVQRGTLHPGDTVVAGSSYGRVRALINPKGEHVKQAVPADPVEILGLGSVPVAGDEFRVFADERDARHLAEERALRERLAEQQKGHMTLDELFGKIEEGKTVDLNLILKADVQGSIEALVDAFSKMDQSEVRINVVHSAVGGITETDVTLAAASDAVIIGFNVRPTGKSRQNAEREKVDIRLYNVIYKAIEDINAARVGMLSPDIVEKDTGIAEVRETFKVPKAGTIAGCYVLEGEISRDDKVRVVRDGTVVFEGEIGSLRHLKDDVKTIRSGFECGIGVSGFQDVKIGDTIEAYTLETVERTE
ncbi:MAG: translation initiation factor IF-2 [Phoenicibacter congonensis]|uniref:Translation initiation factor IF-2 n=1 Tax=Phoenicibacter congonensis TaxID=1944646 RepID=A0AA43UB30_9ACTN|nr:translation initiation factor IF-2 [Phoenicibacter congonensis]